MIGVVSLRVNALRSLHTAARVCSGARADGWWIKDHKPNVFPTTVEDRRKAAQKYGLRFEDYKTLSEDRWAVGDYPELGYGSFDHKDPYENWSHPWYRRNFNEPVPAMWDAYRYDRASFTGSEHKLESPKYSVPGFIFWTLFLGGGVYYFFFRNDISLTGLRYVTLKKPKQYAYDYGRAIPFQDPEKFPIVNYSFEPADSSHH